MALKGTRMGLLVVLVTIVALWVGVETQSSSCTAAIVILSPCLNFIMGNLSTPSPPCCSLLSNVATSQARCLCALLNGRAFAIGHNINQTQALSLPSLCNVQTPPISQCNFVGAPATFPSRVSIRDTNCIKPSLQQEADQTQCHRRAENWWGPVPWQSGAMVDLRSSIPEVMRTQKQQLHLFRFRLAYIAASSCTELEGKKKMGVGDRFRSRAEQ